MLRSTAGWAVWTALIVACDGGGPGDVPYAPRQTGVDARDASRPAARMDAGPIEGARPSGRAGARSPPPGGCEDGPQRRVLFIGNSYTAHNDLAALVTDLACAAGTRLVTRVVAPGGASLGDHAANPATLAAITADAWDFVVLQDQSQTPGWRLGAVDREPAQAAQRLVDAIRDHRPEATPIFFMTWGRRDGDAENCDYYPLVCSFEGHTRALWEGYRLYGERTRSRTARVGWAWAALRRDMPAALNPRALWADDASHPTLAGSYLAAAVLAGTLLPIEIAGLAESAGLSSDVAEALRVAADREVEAERSNPRVDTVERVRIACDPAVCDAALDASAVTITLSTQSCADLSSRDASAAGRITTTLSCAEEACTTVALGGWYDVPGAAIAEATYSVHAHVDANGNREIDAGDLEACAGAGLAVGGGEDLTLADFVVR